MGVVELAPLETVAHALLLGSRQFRIGAGMIIER
jgi:hypothetical protein